jgi:hypothetical protein
MNPETKYWKAAGGRSTNVPFILWKLVKAIPAAGAACAAKK